MPENAETQVLEPETKAVDEKMANGEEGDVEKIEVGLEEG